MGSARESDKRQARALAPKQAEPPRPEVQRPAAKANRIPSAQNPYNAAGLLTGICRRVGFLRGPFRSTRNPMAQAGITSSRASQAA